jgi:HEPN domain-containing protein
MSDKILVDEWLEIANDDLEAAQYLFGKPHRKQLEIICYHCQQCAEKSLKAFLCANGVAFTKTHEVELLCGQCSEIEPAFSKFYDACETLEIYATKTRYPNRVDINEHDAKKAIQEAAEIYQFAYKQIQQLFENKEQ